MLHHIFALGLVSYNFCMIPNVLTVTFGLNLSGAWGEHIQEFDKTEEKHVPKHGKQT